MILIVDDDRTLRSVLREALLDRGYQVLEGANGREGLELALGHNPDLVISDIVMPEVDGWDFCQTMRSTSKTQGIPFVFLTSLDQAPEKVLALRLGADAFLNKPFNADEMLKVVEELLGRVRKRDEVVSGETFSPEKDKTSHIIVDTVEFLRSTGRDGVISVLQGERKGCIGLSSGKVTHASFGSETGERALVAMLRCGDGQIRFREEKPALPVNIEMAWQDIMASLSDRG